jgi:hypothetical protein
MTRIISSAFCCAILLLWGTTGLCSSFDERLWEKYAEIGSPAPRVRDSLAGVYLEPRQLGDVNAGAPFADLRVMTDRKSEVPWQVISRRPERHEEEIPHRMQNLSLTEKGESWLELLVEREGAVVNAVEVITPDSDFSRQVEVLGSADARSWNTLRRDGVIFDMNRGEKLRRTRITFPQIGFRHIALRINNAGAQPLTISGVKLLQESASQGETYTIHGTIGTQDINTSLQESSIVVRMETVFPIDRMKITTTERNFQRLVEVQVKRGTGEWQRWAQGTIFSFDTQTMHESQWAIDMPEVAAREFRLVFRNLDSTPLPVTSVRGEGYRRLLVFKQQAERKLYLFWGNPLAKQPRFDLAGAIAKQNLDGLPLAYLGEARANTSFAGNNARLPFTERYRYILYIVVTLAIAGLVLLQYRVFRHVEK